MPSYRFNSKFMAYAKQCSSCKTFYVGTDNEDASIKVFEENFASANGSSGMADNLQSRCRACNTRNRRDLGVSLEWIRDMHQFQEGCCVICAIPISLDRGSPNPANVDHNHSTGKIRQLLCGQCNRGLGCFYDNPDFLRSAADYLDYHKGQLDD